MPRRKKDSFEVALDAATTRYGKAVKEREHAVQTLDALNREIPQLQQTIRVLQQQLGKEVMPNESKSNPIRATAGDASAQTRPAPTEMKFVRDGKEITVPLPLENLASAGSIPYAGGAKTEELNEDELLPEIDGVQLTED